MGFKTSFLSLALAIFAVGLEARAEHGDLSTLDSQGGGGASIPSTLSDTSGGAVGSGGTVDLGDGGVLAQPEIPALAAPNTISAEEAAALPDVPTLESYEAQLQNNQELIPRNSASLRRMAEGENQRRQQLYEFIDSRTR